MQDLVASFLKPPKVPKEVADTDSAYRGLKKTLGEMLLVEGQRTEVNKLQITLDEMSAKQRAAITPEREKELFDMARKVDLNKVLAQAAKSEAEGMKELAAQTKQNAADWDAYHAKQDEVYTSTQKTIDQIEFETSIMKLSTAEREKALALHELELKARETGIDTQAPEYLKTAVRLANAMDMKAAVEANKTATSEITQFWKQAARNMESSMSSFFFDVMQGNLASLGASFKRTIDQMVSNILAAKAQTTLFGSDFGKGGDNLGGLVGAGLSALGLSGGGTLMGGLSSTTGYQQLAFANVLDSLAVGSDYIPQTGLYELHQGEKVTPAGENATSRMAVTNVFHISGPIDKRSQAQISAAAGQGVQRALARNT